MTEMAICPLCRSETSSLLKRADGLFRCNECRLVFLAKDGVMETPAVAPMGNLETVKGLRQEIPSGSIILLLSSVTDALRAELDQSYTVVSMDMAFPGQRFTALLGRDVLGWHADPVKFLKSCKERLIGGGWLYLEEPNIEQALVSLYDIPEFRGRLYGSGRRTFWNMMTLASAVSSVGFASRCENRQEKSLWAHLHWLWNKCPVPENEDEYAYHVPIPKEHPLHPFLGRYWYRLDQEYRLGLQTAMLGDTIVLVARREEI